MSIRLLTLPLLLLVLGIAQAAPVAVEAELAQDHLKVMERFLTILDTVKDIASAKRAQPELAALSKQNQGLFKKAKNLSISNDTMVKYIQKHHKARSAAIFQGIFSAMDKISEVPEFEKIGEYISTPVNDLSNTTWASVSF
jgi:hypothetical protein